MIGKIISNYKIEAEIGSGGMGTVYLAQDQKLDRKVAIKLLHSSYIHHSDIYQRFKQEAKILAQMQHPNIVTLYDYIEDSVGTFLVMEYIQGIPLDEYIRQKTGPIPEDQAIILMQQILQAFGYAHQRGIVHRDIKPSNIMVTEDKRIKILDFGIAKVLEKDSTMTQAGTKMGTVMFMSPEQVKGGAIEIPSDIYSLGVTLFQMITGKEPYDAQTHSEYDVTIKIVQEPLARLKEIYPPASEGMQKVIDKATEKDSQRRYPSAAAFGEALDALVYQKTNELLSSKYSSQGSFSSPEEINNHTYETSAQVQKKYPLPILFLLLLLVGVSIYYFFFYFNYTQKDVEKRVIAFYDKMNNHDITLYDFYATTLVNWFGQEHVKAEKLKLNTSDLGENVVDTSSFAYTKDVDNNHLISFKRTYIPVKGKTIERFTIIKMKPNLKIYWISNTNGIEDASRTKGQEPNTTEETQNTTQALQFIQHFFEVTSSQDIEGLLQLYHNPVRRWFLMSNANHATIRKEAIRYWSNIRKETYNVLEPSFQVSNVGNGNKLLEVDCLYEIVYKNGEKRSGIEQMRMWVNQDWKITEVEDIKN